MYGSSLIVVRVNELKGFIMFIILLAILSIWTKNAQTTGNFHYGSKRDENYHLYPKKIHNQSLIDSLPKEFDAREHWPKCQTIKEIRDQGECGSCWAFGPVEVMSDRLCIHSNGKIQKRVSVEEVVGCDHVLADGCNGGTEFSAFLYWITKGIVTGGGYNSSQGCLPYEVPSCIDYIVRNDRDDCPYKNYNHQPKCKQSCRPGYETPFEADKSYGEELYTIPDEKQMMAEIFENGPIISGFAVYSDFESYKGGIYSRHPNTQEQGLHCIKIIGWGEEDGRKFWWVANSWGTPWGLGGFVKILRGVNECDIESFALAAMPKL